MSRPGIEPGPPAWEASTLEKSHLDSLSAGYSEPLLGLRRNIRHLYTTIQKGKEGRSRIQIFFLGEGGERLGLAVEEEERLGLALVLSIFNCTNISRGVPS